MEKEHLNWALKIMMNSNNQKRERRGEEAFQIETTTPTKENISYYSVMQKGLVQQRHRMFSKFVVYITVIPSGLSSDSKYFCQFKTSVKHI